MIHPALGPLTILCTGDESLEDALFAARRSQLSIGGEPIIFDLYAIVPGGVRVLRELLHADVVAIRTAVWAAEHDLARDYMTALAARYRQILWLTWRAYRAAMRAKDTDKNTSGGETMDAIRVTAEIGGETWAAEVFFGERARGPQYDQAPANVSRDGERVDDVRWANTFGGAPPEWGLVDNGCLWAPGVVGVKPRTASAFARLTVLVQQAAWMKRGPGRARPIRAEPTRVDERAAL